MRSCSRPAPTRWPPRSATPPLASRLGPRSRFRRDAKRRDGRATGRIVEKFRAWSDCGGDVESVFPLDDLITTAMLFWTTDSIGTSFRPCIDDPEQPPQPPVTVPAAIAIAKADRGYSRVLAEHTYRDIRSFEPLPHGRHFVAREVPQAVAALARSLHSVL